VKTDAEVNQERKRAYLPPVWPLLAIIAAIIVIAVIVKH
jgi:hypothetical protein